MYYKTLQIIEDLERCIINKEPFSIAKMGDGELKLFAMESRGEISDWKFEQQGLKKDLKFLSRINKLVKKAANEANYVGGFGVYFEGHEHYWPRKEYSKWARSINSWEKNYKRAEITNTNYCSPEVGFYFFMNGFRNLFETMKNRKVLFVTCWDNIQKENPFKKLGYDVDFFIIPKRNTEGWKSFDTNLVSLSKMSSKYDFILLSGGTLGRCYSGQIKKSGGRVVEIGQVSNVWSGLDIPPRINRLISYNKDDLSFDLKEVAKKYASSI